MKNIYREVYNFHKVSSLKDESWKLKIPLAQGFTWIRAIIYERLENELNYYEEYSIYT